MRGALEEAVGATAGLAQLRDAAFDAVLLSHEPGQLDALEVVNGLRAGGAEEPLLILGEASEQEMAALAFEVGADAYVCANTATTRTLLWIVARATERHRLIRENRRLAEAERHRLRHEQAETERMLTEQRSLSAISTRPRARCATARRTRWGKRSPRSDAPPATSIRRSARRSRSTIANCCGPTSSWARAIYRPRWRR